MIAPLHSTSEWRPRLKSAGDPINGGLFDACAPLTALVGTGRIGEIVRLRASTQANIGT